MEGEIRQLFNLEFNRILKFYFRIYLLTKMTHTFAYWKNPSWDFENILPSNEREHLLSIKCEKVNSSGIFLILMPAMTETWVWSLGWEDPLKMGKATHSSILAWRIPWTGSQRVGHDWETFTFSEWFKS